VLTQYDFGAMIYKAGCICLGLCSEMADPLWSPETRQLVGVDYIWWICCVLSTKHNWF